PPRSRYFISFQHPATPATYTLSLHDALPISRRIGDPKWHQQRAISINRGAGRSHMVAAGWTLRALASAPLWHRATHYCDYEPGQDRKSTRLNSSHLGISYAVFCLKKKKNRQ